MSQKSEIIAYIKTLLTLNPSKTSRTDHEEYIFNGDDQLLDNLYALSTFESQLTISGITISNGNFGYNVYITKTGGKVLLSGNFTIVSVSNLPAQSIIFSIDGSNTEYIEQGSVGGFHGIAYNTITGESTGISLSSNDFKVRSAVASGEIYNFSLEYITEN